MIGAGGGGITQPGVGEIFVLYLDPTRRGEGIGTLILDAITEQERAQGAREQWVSVEPENRKGLPFYFAVASKYTASGPNGAPRPKKGMFLSGSCDDSSLSSPPQDRSPLVTFRNAGPGEHLRSPRRGGRSVPGALVRLGRLVFPATRRRTAE